jgi:hypothetical protein
MTEPATLPGDDETTIRSGGHGGKVYVHNPLDGEVKELDPDEASTLVYNRGWAPVSKADATRIDAHQILKKSIDPIESIGLGLERGVSGGLSDLVPVSPDLQRARGAVDEEFPWLTGGSEAAGFLAPFGVGAGLGAVGQGVTTALRGGEELGVLGSAATRAAGMGVEGAAYGGIGEARESAIQDDPLTAQKLLSGMFGGAIIAGGLGAGVGALEGSGSLLRNMFKSSAGAREELRAPGLRDSDISPILERAGIGPLEPGALQKLQALLYNDPNITPEFLAAMAKSPGIRDDVMLAAGPARAEAEAKFASALNDLHEGNQDALAGWQGKLKRDKVANWIGPETEHVSDSGNLVEMLKIMDVRGRFNLSQDIVEAVERAGKANPEAFAELMNSVSATSKEQALKNIDRALLHGNKDVLDQLFSSKLLNDEAIARLTVPEDIGAQQVNKLGVKNADFNRDPESYRDMRVHRAGYEGATPEQVKQIARGEIKTMNESQPFKPVAIHIEADGQIHLNDGRHRLLAAQEAGADEILAKIRTYDSEGNVLSEHVAPVSINGIGDPATAQADLRKVLRLAPKADKIEPMWKTAALDYVDRQLELLGELQAQPKGYVAGKGAKHISNLGDLMRGAKQSILEGDRANAFAELDFVKKRLSSVRGGGRIATGEGVRGYAQSMHEEARQLLEDSGIWGAKAAAAQKEMNAILHEHFHRSSDFKSAFFSEAGIPDPKDPWQGKLVADPAKIRGVMDRLVNPERSIELQKFKAHIGDSNRLADMMEKYYSPDEAGKSVIAAMRAGTGTADKAMNDAMHFAMRENQGKLLSHVAHGGALGMASHVAAYALGGPLGIAGSVIGKALMNPGRMWRMQAIVERMMGSHGGRVAEGLANVVTKAGKVGQKSTRFFGSAAMLTQDVESRQASYHDTLHDLAAMASNREMAVQAISSWHGPDLAHMPNVIPAMADAIQRGAQFCLRVAPARPQPGMFSDDELGLLSDSEAEEFSHTVHAAMDPASIFEFIKKGQLTPQILKAAETAAPELVDDMRDQAVQMFTNTAGSVKVGAVQQAGLALLLGVTPSPVYVATIQATWQEKTNPTKKITPGNMGDTGVNDRYSQSTYSASDRIESGEHQP